MPAKVSNRELWLGSGGQHLATRRSHVGKESSFPSHPRAARWIPIPLPSGFSPCIRTDSNNACSSLPSTCRLCWWVRRIKQKVSLDTQTGPSDHTNPGKNFDLRPFGHKLVHSGIQTLDTSRGGITLSAENLSQNIRNKVDIRNIWLFIIFIGLGYLHSEASHGFSPDCLCAIPEVDREVFA